MPNSPHVFCRASAHLSASPLQLPRDYYSDIEAVVTSRLASWKVQHLGLWTDVVEPHAAPMSIPTAADLMEIEDESQAAKFREIRAKVAQDVAAMTQYNASVQEHTRRLHVVKVMREKSQVEAGKQLLEFAKATLSLFCFDVV